MSTTIEFDPTGLLELCDGDGEIALEVITAYREDQDRMLDTLRRAVFAGDGAATCEAAHALKGAVGNFGDAACQTAAFALERAGRVRDMGDAPAQLQALTRELARLEDALARFAGELENA